MTPPAARSDAWPNLPLDDWKDTAATLHLWTQIVGKVRLAQTPWMNHSWHVTLYVTPRGLTTSPIPYRTRTFEIDFDFIGHQLRVRTCEGDTAGFALEPQPVASFYRRVVEELERLDLHVKINRHPNEVPDPIPFDRDDVHRDVLLHEVQPEGEVEEEARRGHRDRGHGHAVRPASVDRIFDHRATSARAVRALQSRRRRARGACRS